MSEVWLPEGLPHHGYPQSLLRCSECVRKWNSAPRDETAAQKAAVRFPLEHLTTHLAGSHRQGALSSSNSLLESYCMCLQELKCTNIQRKWIGNPELDALDRETGYLKLGRWLDFTKLTPGSLPGVVSNSIPQPPSVHNQAASTQAPRAAWNGVQQYPTLAEQAAARKLASGTALNGFKQPSIITHQAVAPVSAVPARTWASKFQGSPAHTMNGVPPARTQRRQAAVAPTQGPSPAVQQTSMPSSQLYASVAASSLATPSADSPFKQGLQQLHQTAAPSPAVSLSTTPSPAVASRIPQQLPIVGHYDIVANPAAVNPVRTFACKVCTQAMPGVNFPQMIRADLEKHGREVHRLRDGEISSLFSYAGYKCQLCIAMFSPAMISSLPCMDQEDLENHGLRFHRLTQAELTQYTASSVCAVLSASGVGVASANNILNHSTAINFSPELASYAPSAVPTTAKPAHAAVQPPPVVQGIPITPQNSAALFEAIVAPKDAHAPKPKPASKTKPAPKLRGRKPKTELAETATGDTEVKVPAKRKRAKKPSKGYTCHLCTADNRWKKQTPMDFNGLMEHGLQHHAIPQSQIETFFTAAAGALISVHQHNVNKDTVQSILAEPDTAQVIFGVVSKTTPTAPQGTAAVTPRTAQGSFNVASPQAPNSPLSSLQNQFTQNGTTQNSVGNNSIANNGLSQNTIRPVVYKTPSQTLLSASATPARVEAAAETVDEGDIQWLKDIFGDDLLMNDASDQSASPGSSEKQSQKSVTEPKATPDSEAAHTTGNESTSDLGADFEAEFDASWNAQYGAEGTSQKQVDDIANAASDGALRAVKLAGAIPETPAPNTQVVQITEQPAVGKEMEISYDFSSESRAERRFDDDDHDDSDEELIDLLAEFLNEPEKDSSQVKYVGSSSDFTAESSFVQMPKNNKSPLDNFGKLWFRGLDPTVLLPQEMIQELGLKGLPTNRKDLACLYANDEDGELGVVAADGVAETKWLNMQEWHQFKEAHLEDYAPLLDHELNMVGSYGQSVDEIMNYDFLGLGNMSMSMSMSMKHGRGDDDDIWGDSLVDKRARLFY